MILEGNASDILHDWVKERYQIFYKYDGIKVSGIQIYEPETDLVFLPNEETEYFLSIIFTH